MSDNWKSVDKAFTAWLQSLETAPPFERNKVYEAFAAGYRAALSELRDYAAQQRLES